MDNHGISIIIPTYNRALFLRETIESVLNQQIEDAEIIVSDDGSTDNTLEIARSFGPKIKILVKPPYCHNQGVAATRNRGIHAASKAYLSFLDSDDFYMPGHLIRMIASLDRDPRIDFAFCRILETRQENGKNVFRPWSHKVVLENDVKNPVVSRSHIVHTNAFIFRSGVFREAGLFNEAYSNGEDGDEWMRISEKFRGKFLDHYGVAYRTNHGMNQLTGNPGHHINSCALEILGNARKRYYDLKLNDARRIFKIEYDLLRLRYRKENRSPYLYYLKYTGLILRYPSGYWQKSLEAHYEKKEPKSSGGWKEADHYCAGEP